ncbi:MAG: glutathione synthase [Deltaproteobacteria bacterium]|nr:glutathione synthase [Deltaproteobacteria bacterium]
MILSFHPCFEADENRLCAGKLPDENDLARIRSADAVVLPQGCSRELYRMVSRNCARFFPDYTARFAYPGKLGQARLFLETGACHPDTQIFERFSDYAGICKINACFPTSYPFVLKMDWGGEGDNVHLIASADELEQSLGQVKAFEATGQYGFLIQQYIPSGFRSLRIVVIYRRYESYWRSHDNPGNFCASLSKGARMDRVSDPGLQEMAVQAVREFCARTHINLAGFDILFSSEERQPVPLFLEINYFFGRQGIGGSEAYYALLVEQIHRWIADQKLR